MKTKIVSYDQILSLFKDASVKEKLKVMDKWEVMFDDSRNPDINFNDEVEKFLKLGKKYRIQMSIEEVGNC
jgi:hypothetical protein